MFQVGTRYAHPSMLHQPSRQRAGSPDEGLTWENTMVSRLRNGSWMLVVLTSALLTACSDGGGDGGGGGGGTPSCDAMKDDAALEEAISLVVTNQRSEPVYLTTGGCAPTGWAVDGKTLFDPAPPTCEGLLVGEPGGETCAPVYEELAAGASVTVAWHGRAVESVPVVEGCPDPPAETYETCSRHALVGEGSHELRLEVFLQYDQATRSASSPLLVDVPFDLPAASVAVNIAP